MKVKKIKFRQILKLHLLKSKVYERNEKKNSLRLLTDMSLVYVISNFKKALQIIFQYHKMNKRILFIGIPSKLELKINQLTNHVSVSDSFDLQRFVSKNDGNILPNTSKTTKKSVPKSLLPKLSKTPDLIVLFSHYKKESIISDIRIAKIPLILFNEQNSPHFDYNVSGIKIDQSLANHKNIFFLGLNFLFKKFI